MMKLVIVAPLVVLLAASGGGNGVGPVQVNGSWSGSTNSGDGMNLFITQSGTTISSQNAGMLGFGAIMAGTVSGNKVTMNFTPSTTGGTCILVFTGIVSGAPQ